MNSYVTERERGILDLLTGDSGISVSEIGKQLGVSAVTVRAGLNSLAQKGLVVRTWGGAAPAFHPEMLEHQRTRVEEKNRIARAAAALIEDGEAIMIEAGTTTALIARYLTGKRDVSIVTNNLLVLPYARSNPSLRLTLVGGDFRHNTESLVGPVALQELERFHVRRAFVGTDGFTPEKGLTTHLVEGAEIVKKMAGQAQETVLVADSSKYGKTGFVLVLPLARIGRLIVDSNLAEEAISRLREQNLRLEIV
ncbi:MAG: DeoR/GlpR family DNA-binding transcription regulator [Spirochaetales bacterium]|nr:DeoR/GlpR family DNA-binding transcription regulator [Spirochaetales bacterium]